MTGKVYIIVDGKRIPLEEYKNYETEEEKKKDIENIHTFALAVFKESFESKFPKLNVEDCLTCEKTHAWNMKSKSNHPCPEFENCERCKKI